VPVGTYQLKISLVGYAELEVNNVEVSADLATYQNHALTSKPAELGKTIEVTAQRPLVQKDMTATMNIVTQSQIRALPTRGYDQLVGIQNGVVKIQRSPATSFRGNREAVQTDELDIRGGRPSEVAYYVDGFSQQDPLTGNSTANIANDAIKEVTVIAGGFPAEYGNVASGIVNTITASGTDKYAVDVDLVSDNITKNNYDNNYYSADFGGPIPGLKKAYFFFSGERRWLGDRAPTGLNKDMLALIPDSAKTAMGIKDYRLPGNSTSGWSYQGKIDYNLNPNMKISLSGTGSDDRWQLFRQDFLFDYQHAPWYHDKNLGLNAKWTHTLNAKTFYNLSTSYFVTSRFSGDGVWKDNIWAYGRINGNPRYDDEALFWDYNNPATPDSFQTVTVDGVDRTFLVTVPNGSNEASQWDDYYKRKSSYIDFKGDITSQLSAQHTAKAGFEFQRHTLRYYHHLYPYRVYQGTNAGGFQDVDRYGYDIYGNESNSQGWQNSTKHPINLAFYAQDRAEWTGFIVNAGLRFDYFDYKAQRLLDPTNPLDPATQTLTQARLVPSKKFTRLSPRLGIAFPISDKTQMHLNFGKFYQRPDLIRLYVGYDFFEYKAKTGGYFYPIGNPNLEPEKTTQYEVGLTHQLGDFTAVELTAYYKDVQGLVQVLNQAANPQSFTYYANSDYSNIKGLEASLTMRRNHNIQMSLKYTLSYANGTGSYANTEQNIAWTASTVPKQTAPLDYDQRHNLIGIFDYRLGAKQGPKISDVYPLENFGINFVIQAASGTPYTPEQVFNEVTLAAVAPVPAAPRNSSYGPWTLNIDMKAERSFNIGQYRITPYLWVKNLLNRKNVYVVYESTGRPNSTGWLDTPSGQDFVSGFSTPDATGLNGEQKYLLKENNPQNYGNPRMILFGLRMSF
jgi:outer membrane receptor protein involved in Fe transport